MTLILVPENTSWKTCLQPVALRMSIWLNMTRKAESCGALFWAPPVVIEDMRSRQTEGGNVYISGQFSGEVDFDPGPGEFVMTGEPFKTAYLASYDNDGNFRWAVTLAGLSGNSIQEIEVDEQGNLYLVGNFGGTADLDPGEEEFLITAVGITDVFAVKYDAAMNLLWGLSFGDDGLEAGNTIDIDAEGNVIIGGSFFGTIDVDPGPGVAELVAGEDRDAFVAKYDRSGGYVAGINIGGDASVFLQDLEVDSQNRITTTGFYNTDSLIDFDPGSGEFLLDSEGTGNAYIARYDAQLAFDMAIRFGGANRPSSNELELKDDGSIYVAGTMFKEHDFDPGPGTYPLGPDGDVFIAKFTEYGAIDWAMQIGYAFFGMTVHGLALDHNGLISIAGDATDGFSNNLDFDPTQTSYIVENISGNQDLFLARYRDPDPLFRVNAGGSRVADTPLAWERDTKLSPSQYVNARKDNNKTGTVKTPLFNPTAADDMLFRKYRWDPTSADDIPMSWTFPVEPGDYKVCLLFAEHDEDAAGKRVFDIVVQGETRFEAFDIYAETGGATAMRNCFFAQAELPHLRVQLMNSITPGRPIISGIEVTPATASVSDDEEQGSISAKAPATEPAKIADTPLRYALNENYPNPFNPTTTLQFTLAETGQVRLTVFDMLGREVARLVDGVKDAGEHAVVFEAGSLPSGTYLYRLDTPVGTFTQKMMLLK